MTQEEATKLIEAIQAQVDKPEPEKFIPKKGQLCYFWDWTERPKFPVIREFLSMAGQYYEDMRHDPWQHCAPYIAKATRQEWHGGECPVEPDAYVAIECRSGSFAAGQAGGFDWVHSGRSLDIHYLWELGK